MASNRGARRLTLANAARLLACIAFALLLAGPRGSVARAQQAGAEVRVRGLAREGYPLPILERLRRESARRDTASVRMNAPFALMVPLSRRWQHGHVIKVAFSRGSRQLHEAIENAVQSWTIPNVGANVRFNFRNEDGTFRMWSNNDLSYQADIRIDFVDDVEYGGLWSMVGADSINPRLVGAGEASMNLENFDRALPRDWRTTVLHEFGHALGFEHEHQSPLAQCGFRFYDDRNYVPTEDDNGMAIEDDQHRQPGLYRYLGGPPWNWSREKVDFNLETLSISDEYLSSDAFDNLSIMRYWFPAQYFETGRASVCWSEGENEEISALDLASARRAYPWNPNPELVQGRQLITQLFLGVRENSRLAAALHDAAKAELNQR